MPIAAIDFGRRWIGIAVNHGAGLGVYPVETIERRALKHDLELGKLFVPPGQLGRSLSGSRRIRVSYRIHDIGAYG